ncbi:LAMI_0E13366g1_1 [Lachancea mirantina]|uniref:LAMI_0E13366g1_1 n=1 Tax=Lachancea mirantina TaxID=1230905 RepID=A0A1G4JQS2_9SACH|nr:LAMI_0E13366g1_1 [Lachancea mirantina]
MSQEPLFFDKTGHLEFGPDDVDNPKNYSLKRKCYVTGIAILLVMNATFASSAPSGSFQSVSEDLKVSAEAAGLVTTLFLVGYCAGPLFWAPLSEFYGRRNIFWISFALYLAFGFLCAFAPNFGALLAGRFLTGAAASAALTNAPGILADVWGAVGRGNAMVLFATMTFVGPALGPVVSGFLQVTKNWRWTFYVLLWMAGLTQLLLLTLPETLPAMALRNKARRVRRTTENDSVRAPVEDSDRSLGGVFKIALTRPWKLLVDPISFLVSIYYALVYTLLYMLFSIYPIVFQQKRQWNAGIGELPLIGTVVGACIGGLLLFVNTQIRQRRFAHGRTPVPEDRLPGAMVGAVMFAVTIFWFAWTAEYDSIPWAVPTVAGTFLATSILLIFVTFINYIIDTYLMYAASAVAANTVLRSACAASSPLFTQYMFDAMGVGGAGSLIGGLGVLLMPMPFVFYKYGALIRAKSKFASTEETRNPPADEESLPKSLTMNSVSNTNNEPLDERN